MTPAGARGPGSIGAVDAADLALCRRGAVVEFVGLAGRLELAVLVDPDHPTPWRGPMSLRTHEQMSQVAMTILWDGHSLRPA